MSDSWLKLAQAEEAFGIFRTECTQLRKKMAISQLAARSGVDRKYFYGHVNTPDDKLRLRWKTLGDEIKRFNVALRERNDASSEEQLSPGDKLRNAITENYSLVESVGQLRSIKLRMEGQLTQAREKNEMLEERIRLLEVRLYTEPAKSVSVQFTNKPLVLSPDKLATGDDSLSRTQAWVKAIKELRALLRRPLEKNLYITIGVPGSGKSTWATALQASNKLLVVFDACSITKSDRYEILDIASAYNNVRRIAVIFNVPLNTALERNRFRSLNNRVPEEKISAMYESLEFPELFDDIEIFDEIIMVRS